MIANTRTSCAAFLLFTLVSTPIMARAADEACAGVTQKCTKDKTYDRTINGSVYSCYDCKQALCKDGGNGGISGTATSSVCTEKATTFTPISLDDQLQGGDTLAPKPKASRRPGRAVDPRPDHGTESAQATRDHRGQSERTRSIEEIVDGTSNTILLSEQELSEQGLQAPSELTVQSFRALPPHEQQQIARDMVKVRSIMSPNNKTEPPPARDGNPVAAPADSTDGPPPTSTPPKPVSPAPPPGIPVPYPNQTRPGGESGPAEFDEADALFGKRLRASGADPREQRDHRTRSAHTTRDHREPSAHTDSASGLRAPSDLVVRSVSPTALVLAWQDNSTDEFGVEVYRADAGEAGRDQGAWKLIGAFEERNLDNVTGTGTRMDEDTGLRPGARYCYRMRAYTGFQRTQVSEFSGAACASTVTTAR